MGGDLSRWGEAEARAAAGDLTDQHRPVLAPSGPMKHKSKRGSDSKSRRLAS
jgi:hypothetical protein